MVRHQQATSHLSVTFRKDKQPFVDHSTLHDALEDGEEKKQLGYLAGVRRLNQRLASGEMSHHKNEAKYMVLLGQ
jgi:hypothetical protein